MEGGEIKKLGHVFLAIITSLSYCHFISSKIPKGKWRLISVLPVVCVFIILPLYLTSVFFTSVITISISWLANFKLLLFAFGQGPLSLSVSCLSSPNYNNNYNNNLPTFIATAVLIFKIKSENKSTPLITCQNYYSNKFIMSLNLAIEIPALVALVKLYDYKEYYYYYSTRTRLFGSIHRIILLDLYTIFVLFLLEDITFTFSSLLAHVLLLRVEIDPPFHEPYLSTSIQDFWGRRWNLPFSSLLRQTVYKPARSVLNRDSTLVVSFLVSGLMHELWFWYLTPVVRPSWELMGFFVVQGIYVVLELRLKLIFTKKIKWPRFLSVLFTFGLLIWMNPWPVIQPTIRNNVGVRLMEELRFFMSLKVFM